MTLEVLALAIFTCLGSAALLLALALLVARYERSILERAPRVGPARRLEDLVLSILFTIAAAAVGTSLAGGPHLLVFGLAFLAGLSLWLWLRSAGAGERNRGRGGVASARPHGRGEKAPRHGRA